MWHHQNFEEIHPIQISWIPCHIGWRYHLRCPSKSQCVVVEMETGHWGPKRQENARIPQGEDLQSPCTRQNAGQQPRSMKRPCMPWRWKCSSDCLDWLTLTMQRMKMSKEDWELPQSQRKGGRPKKLWMDSISYDMQTKKLNLEKVDEIWLKDLDW